METSNIRKHALEWMSLHYPEIKDAVFCSKFFLPAESWSKSRVWFFQIPLEIIDPKKYRHFHLLCENHLNGDTFLYLKVPVSFILLNEKSFEINQKEKVIRLYLSAEAIDMFKEVRKGSKIDFKKYVVNEPEAFK